jgi:Ca2+-binding EF-hand superfamily protein
LELGYSNDEAQQILEEADKDKSGTIDFEEFIQGLEDHLNRILADVASEVQYFVTQRLVNGVAIYDTNFDSSRCDRSDSSV